MKRGSTLFLKFVLLLIAIIVFIWMIVFPQLEGRAATLDLVNIYSDPFIIYMYFASIPFFIALYQAYRLLGYIDANKVFSKASIKTVTNIKNCALITAGLIVATLLYIRFTVIDDDPAGFVGLGIITTFTSLVIATASAVFQKLLQNAVDLKSENDLTV